MSKTPSFFNIAQSALTSVADIGPLVSGLGKLATSFQSRKQSLGRVLEQQAAKRPNAEALVFEKQVWTYQSFNRWVNRFAHAFAAQGLKKGDSVAIFIENRPEALACIAAAAKLGVVAGMINTAQRGAVLQHSLSLVRPTLVIAGDELVEHVTADILQAAAPQAKCFWLPDQPAVCPEGWDNLDTLVASERAENPSSTVDVEMGSPLFYIFTSGTTGLPKASIMSHYRWMAAGAGMGSMGLRLRSTDILYCPLPLYHNNALTVSWGSVLNAGATLALSRKFSASNFWREVRDYNATAFCYIGELCRYLLNQPRNELDTQHKVTRIIGNGLRADLWEEFKQRFQIERIGEFYGASEGNVAFINAFNMDKTAGFCPYPFAVVEYDVDEDHPVINAKGRMNKVATGETGLLITKVTGRTPFDGYTNASESDKKLFRNALKNGDCWFNTGDLVQAQGYGHIAFVDRVGDTFRWKGENVATTEVEAAFGQFDNIDQAVVYGVEIPKADGRVGMAAITPKHPEIDWLALAQGLQRTLPSYAVPAFIRVKTQQDVTGTFKYKKSDLKKESYRDNAEAETVYILHNDHYRPIQAADIEALEQGQYRL